MQEPDKAMSHKQRERLVYIEFRLYFLGEVRRADLMARFGVSPAVATRDFALYRELAPENLTLNTSTKAYETGQNFVALYEHSLSQVLAALTQGEGYGVTSHGDAMLPCEFPVALNRVSIPILAAVTRAIHLKKVLKIVYHSTSSGEVTRSVVPFAIVDTGLRWHARAFDRKSGEFRDFVMTRMLSAEIVDSEIAQLKERMEEDREWMRVIELELIPHPAQADHKIAELDYGMVNGELKLSVRAANAGYILRRWSVDCSSDHYLRGGEYRLALKDPMVLYRVDSARLAPGYYKVHPQLI